MGVAPPGFRPSELPPELGGSRLRLRVGSRTRAAGVALGLLLGLGLLLPAIWLVCQLWICLDLAPTGDPLYDRFARAARDRWGFRLYLWQDRGQPSPPHLPAAALQTFASGEAGSRGQELAYWIGGGLGGRQESGWPATGPEQSLGYYFQAAQLFHEGADTQALKQLAAGNAAPQNALPWPCPYDVVVARLAQGQPSGSVVLTGALTYSWRECLSAAPASLRYGWAGLREPGRRLARAAAQSGDRTPLAVFHAAVVRLGTMTGTGAGGLRQAAELVQIPAAELLADDASLTAEQREALDRLVELAGTFTTRTELLAKKQERLFHVFSKAHGIDAWLDRAYYTTPRFLRYRYAHWKIEFHDAAALQTEFARLAAFDYVTLSWPEPQE